MPLPAYRLLLLLLLIPFFTKAQNRNPQLQNEPVWVTHPAVSYNSATLEPEAENGVIDLVFEKQISVATQSLYTRRALKYLSEAGVQNSSEISVSYDPTYQQLLFHNISLLRDGRLLNKLQLSKIKTVQQQLDLNN